MNVPEGARAEFEERGYVVFEHVLDRGQVNDLRAALEPHFAQLGRNHFEGYHTQRVYALLAKAPQAIAQLVSHPLALEFAARELGPNFLLSACLAIKLHPGETAQGWHFDDGNLRIPRPRAAYGVSAFWTLDDTTETNGATEVIPGSHLWGDDADIAMIPDTADPALKSLQAEEDLQPRDDAVKVCMPAGSLMLAKGTLWHRGGANRSDESRLVITPQYCPGWARQLENMLLAVPPHVARELPKRVRELLGYNIHGSFMGYVDGLHPERTLEQH